MSKIMATQQIQFYQSININFVTKPYSFFPSYTSKSKNEH